jgi:uncharacterized protein (DUF342 family)
MKVTHTLHRKAVAASLATMGGTKFSENCILIPSTTSDEITAILNSFNVKTKKLKIYINENSSKAWLTQKPTKTSKEPPINITQ